LLGASGSGIDELLIFIGFGSSTARSSLSLVGVFLSVFFLILNILNILFKKTQEKRKKLNKESKMNLKCLKYALRKIKET